MSHSCSCPNGHSWEAGSICPVCGWVAEKSHEAATLPPTAQPLSMAMPSEETLSGEMPQGRAEPHPLPRVAGFEILSELGRGGMGVVYKARQVGLNRVVALKMILGGAHAGADDLRRFRAEAEAVAALQHPNIVQIHDIGEHEGVPYFSLEYCAGGSLAEQLDGTPWQPQEAAALVEMLARAVQTAHRRGIIHRDLKPANILLSFSREPLASAGRAGLRHRPENSALAGGSRLNDYVARITDFGLAKRLDSAVQRTQTGAIMGTPSYMAPEQAGGKNREIGPGVDLHALGAILYELLTGRPPYRAATQLDTLLLVVGQEPVPPRQLNPQVPLDLDTICLKCLQKEPAKRYESADALAEDLRRFRAGEPIAARPVGRLERTWRWCQRNPTTALLATAVAIALLAGAGVAAFFALRAADKAAEAIRNAEQAAQGQRDAEAAQQRALEKEQLAGVRETQAVAARKETEEQLQRNDALLYRTQIAQAQREWEGGNVARALQALEACRWDMRSWEHDRLFTLFQGSQLTLQCEAPVQCVRFSHDGRWVAAGLGGQTGEVQIFDAATGKLERRLHGKQNGEIQSLDVSRDGKWLVCGVDEIDEKGNRTRGLIRVWNLESAKEERTIPLRNYRVSAAGPSGLQAVFSPDGKQIASGATSAQVPRPAAGSGSGADDSARQFEIVFWDRETGKEQHSIPQREAVLRLAYAPDGKRLAGVTFDGQATQAVRMWDAETLKELWSEPMAPDASGQIRFSEDAKVLIWTGASGVRYWQAAAGKQGGTDSVRGARSLSIVREGVKVWSVWNREEMQLLKGHTEGVTSVDISGHWVVTGSTDRTVRLWDLERTGAMDSELLNRSVLAVKPIPASERFAVLDAAALPQITAIPWKRRKIGGVPVHVQGQPSQGEQLLLREEPGPITQILLSPDGTLIATAGRRARMTYRTSDMEIKLWDAKTGELLHDLTHGEMPTGRLRFVADGKRLIAERHLGPAAPPALLVWNVETGKTVLTLEGQTWWDGTASLRPDERRLAAAITAAPGKTAGVRIWDLLTGKVALTLDGVPATVRHLSYSPDGRWLVIADDRGACSLWDAESGAKKYELLKTGPIVGVASFAADSRKIACAFEVADASANKTHMEIKVWEVDTGKEVLSCATPPLPAAQPGSHPGWARFSRDGKRLVSHRPGDSLRVWDASTGKEIRSVPMVGESQFLTPDGKYLLSRNNEVLIASDVQADRPPVTFDPAKEKTAGGATFQLPVFESRGHPSQLPFSPDGRYCIDRNRVWEVATGKVLFSLVHGIHNMPPQATFSPDSRFVIAAEGPGHIDWPAFLEFGAQGQQVGRAEDLAPQWTIWDLKTGEVVRSIRQPTDAITSMDFRPDGKQVVTGIMATAKAGAVGIWDMRNGNRLYRSDATMPPVTCVSWSPDGKLIAAGCENLLQAAERSRELRIWEADSHREVLVLKGLDSPLTRIRFSPDSRRLLGVGRDKTVRIWDVESGSLVAQLKGHRDRVGSAEFSPDGRQVVTGADDMIIRLWDAQSGKLQRSLKGHMREPFGRAAAASLQAVFTPDGKRVLSGGDDGIIKVWDVRTGQEVATFEQRQLDLQSRVRDLSFDSTGRTLMVDKDRFGDGIVEFWDGSKASDHTAIDSQHQGVQGTSFSPDGKHFVSAGRDRTVRIWDVATGQQVRLLEGFEGDVIRVAYSADGKRLFALTVSSENGAGGPNRSEIKVWDTDNGRELFSFITHGDFIYRLAFSPDGKQLVGGSQMVANDDKHRGNFLPSDARLRIWDIDAQTEIWSKPLGDAIVIGSGFSPDGSRVTSCTIAAFQGFPRSGEIKVWDVREVKELATIHAKEGIYLPPVFSLDGRHFLCGTLVFDAAHNEIGAGSLQLFDTQTGKLVRSYGDRKGSILSAAFSPNGKQILCAEVWGKDRDPTGVVRLLDADSGEELRSFDEAGTADMTPTAVAFSPDGKWIETTRMTGEHVVRSVETGRELIRFVVHEDFGRFGLFFGAEGGSHFSPDGKWLVSPGDQDTINIWPLQLLEKRIRTK